MHPNHRRLTVLLLGLLPGAALAHPGLCSQGLAAGVAHPLLGVDHLLAMVAVGWWSAASLSKRWWLVPLAFVSCLLLGALAGWYGAIRLPASETLIALSLVVFGGLLVLGRQLPLPAACAVAGGFALFHGYAHGVEMPGCGMGAAWLAGMVAATALLHLGGAVAGGFAVRHARWASRLAGTATALTGMALIAGWISA